MRKRTIVIGAAALASAAGGVGVATAVGAGGDDSEQSATGADADRAKAAALAITHGGTANAVERDDEDGATWEVEVTKTDGKTVDVRLDQRFQRVTVESDDDQGGDDASEQGEGRDDADGGDED